MDLTLDTRKSKTPHKLLYMSAHWTPVGCLVDQEALELGGLVDQETNGI